ncbi:Asp-tRNA(Asn)/Glu-tRNA(Gln) amidotransferase subunit GatC [Natranaerobius thermophilus]|uniref:Aspartyl/glutamyl-tRNA(Asn/Gln) amidotransferase subunit C n=1 Tax=Natranaerobius thermophilus (strain ATCC BAA-1301 / DSM 18059 / JW/NM-WN-LF) TaxID=457570 RepID=GATC_NATTJ|nr:Asp-tRNA(Asn)/Glu-tRNA(Gln) amidotransferase subunit GatC [Natranaerobius thermophilus]B2A5W6.1 RecName: Full=Aspartyl/glutamyl-tRNA(Asn/Gln) amidotransferase subunit C; Short=Asp/Glu-ADT subunit C [Natranaerobius thermophilus JW/NM-WN-LF]ACB84059.1 glutamyl-tRNA(Gln) amidotransferase, C subunit [Natranaerobius thermophilus JW/NM-WN-LF]
MKVSKEEVLHVAKLGQLDLDQEEVEMFQDKLSQILEWQEKLDELDLEGLEPTAHALERRNVTREDQVHNSLTNDKALENAPETEGNYFKVPRIIE